MGITKNKQDNENILAMANYAFPDKKVIEIRELTEGMCNAAYEVVFAGDFATVLKIAAAENKGNMTNEVHLMDAEVHAMQLVAQNTQIKLPKVYCYDKSRKFCSGDYFFMEKLEGKSWWSVKDECSNDTNVILSEQVGEISSELTKITNDTFGLLGDAEHRFDSLYEFTYFLIKNVLEDAERRDVYIGVSKKEILDKLESEHRIFDEVKYATLVHYDMWEGNIFVNGDHVTGIIDWERAMWGEPYMDDRFRSHNRNEAFFKGFGKSDFTYDESRRIIWYDIYLYLFMMTEGAYREYEDDGQYRWVKPLFDEAWSKLQ